MFYSIDLIIPANTPASAPLIQEVTINPGIVQQVDVQFPRGCVGLVHTQCRRGSHQLYPSNDEGDFNSDGQTLSWQDDYELNAAPFVMRLFGWNLDDTYPHTVTWRFSLRQLPAGPAAAAAQSAFQQSIGTLEVET